MPDKFTILIVDDDKGIHRLLRQYFSALPYRLLFAADGKSGLDILNENQVFLVLLDLKMPVMGGMEFLKAALERFPGLKVIILSAFGCVRDAVEAIKLGAIDFFEKPFTPEIIRKKVDQVYSAWVLENENRLLRKRLDTEFHFDDLIGESPPIVHLKEMIARVSPTNTSVLIMGESGTGKELVARAIHRHSRRSGEIFMPVDCAAISENMMESELFGHVRGAFTGADSSTTGLLRAADRGTAFFDEVGEFSPKMQAKLLRTIQERMVRPLGSTKSIPVDIRVVSATNRNLVDEVAKGRFRQDFYYRLSGVTLMVPPLRDRVDDIPLLARYFIEKLVREGFSEKRVSDSADAVLQQYNWPGNVRELENVIRHAMSFSRGDIITPDVLPICFEEFVNPAENAILTEPVRMIDHEARAIRNALVKTFGSRRKAARLLGISEATLYRKIRKYGLRGL